MSMSIGRAASLAGCSTPTVRYYEGIGLMPPADRTDSGRRTYGWPDVKRLQFIRRARDFGMSIGQVRALLDASSGGGDCAVARAVVGQRLDEVRALRKELAALEGTLEQMAQRCDRTCAPGEPGCTVFEDMQLSGA